MPARSKPARIEQNFHMAAARAVLAVVDGGRSLDDAMAAHAGAAQTHRHALFQEICYGACRRYHYLDALLAMLLKKPIKPHDRVVHFLLINACYQLEEMRVPDYAAVSASVAALKGGRFAWASPLVNGVLRAFLKQRRQLKRALPAGAARCAFPAWLYEEICVHWPARWDGIIAASNRKPPLTLRVNRLKISRAEYLEWLADAGVAAVACEHSPIGVTLQTPMPAERVPGLADGLVSVQDEAAQLAATAADLRPGMRALDGCAAPGGKTGLLLESQPDLATLVAVDLPGRMDRLRQNLARLGLQAEVVAADLTAPAAWWDQTPFDRIVLDVPCSGSGVIRRHPDIKHRRRPEDLAQFAEQQLNLLVKAWPLLADGGKLLYVTCSILPTENDAVIERFIALQARGTQAQAMAEPLDDRLGVATAFGRQRLPGIHPGDGFYYCRLKKRAA